VAASGAERIAVVRALTEAADPERMATELRGTVDRTGAQVGST
jgi:thiamine monophosphate synthase